MPAPAANLSDLSFEDAMQRLESIVEAMESERMPLSEMVESYDEGARLLQLCRQRIDVARQRVELITTNLENPTQATLSPFDPAAAGDEPETPTPKPRVPNTRRAPAAKPSAPDDDDDIRLF